MRNLPPYFIKQFSEYSFVAPYLLSIVPFPVQVSKPKVICSRNMQYLGLIGEQTCLNVTWRAHYINVVIRNRSVSARASGRCYRGPITWLKHLRGTIYRVVERTLLGYWIGKGSIVAIGDNKISNFLRLLREEKVGNGSD